MIAQRRIELDAGRERGLIGPLEFSFEIPGALTAVEVVAQHQNEPERKLHAVRVQNRSDFILLSLSGAAVANHGESQRIVLQRQVNFLSRNGDCQEKDQNQ
jgi:hypothetical protein